MISFMKHNQDNRSYEDLVVAVGRGDPLAEATLYRKCKEYFMEHVRVLPHVRAEAACDIFQDSFLVIWTEIQNGKIFLWDGRIARINKYGEKAYLTCALTSFLMSIAIKRHFKDIRVDGPDVMVDIDGKDVMGEEIDVELSEDETNMQIIDEEIEKMSPRCRDILTWFYVKGLSLEQILVRRTANTSKDGLKTSKSKCLKQLRDNANRRRRSLYE